MSNIHDDPSGISESEFLRLFVRHEAVLRAFARSILPDWTFVDDALQEASVTMWEKLGQLEDQDGFLPWAKVILRFKCLSAISKARRDRVLMSNEVLELLADEAETMTIEHHSIVRQALRICLSQFSESQQELLLAPYAGDGKVKTLAGQCGKSVNAFYKLLGRLRDKLGECIRGRMQREMA